MIKIISMILAGVMVLEGTGYGVEASKGMHLRVPASINSERFNQGLSAVISSDELLQQIREGDVDSVFMGLINEPKRIIKIVERLQELDSEEAVKICPYNSELFTRLIVEALNNRKDKSRINLGIICALNKSRSILGNILLSSLKKERIWLNIESRGLIALAGSIDIFSVFPSLKDFLSEILQDNLSEFLIGLGFRKDLVSWSWIPRAVDEDFIEDKDLIIVADIYVLKEVLVTYPEAIGKTFLMTHLTKDPASYGQNMEDPLAEKEILRKKEIVNKIYHLAENLILILDRAYENYDGIVPKNGLESDDKVFEELAGIEEFLDEGVTDIIGRKEKGDFAPTSLDRLMKICQKVHIPKGAKVLDLGSGTGKVCILLAIYDELCLKKNMQISGIEYDFELYELGISHKNGLGTKYDSVNRVDFIRSDFFAHTWKDYDVILYAARGSREERRIAEEMGVCLKPGTKFVVYAPIKIEDFYKDRQEVMPELFNTDIFNIEYFKDVGILVFTKKMHLSGTDSGTMKEKRRVLNNGTIQTRL